MIKFQSKSHSFIICLLLGVIWLASCSTQKKTAKASYEQNIKEERKIEKEIEKNLRGDEKKIIEEAFEWLGTKYEYGKQEKGVSTDCSGFVMKVFDKAINCKLPRNSAKQAEYCQTIKRKNLKPGDLVFFITNNGTKINHVGIMIDEVQFIHASSKGVLVSSLESNYYNRHFQRSGRVPCMQH